MSAAAPSFLLALGVRTSESFSLTRRVVARKNQRNDMTKIKVAQFGLGPIGIETLKLAAAKSWAEIVGGIEAMASR